MNRKSRYYLIAGVILAFLTFSCSSKKPQTKAYIIKKKDKAYIIIKKGDEKTVIKVDGIYINEKDLPQLDSEDEQILFEESIKTGIKILTKRIYEIPLLLWNKKQEAGQKRHLTEQIFTFPMIKSVFKNTAYRRSLHTFLPLKVHLTPMPHPPQEQQVCGSLSV
ncbi:MAG: hypothetical protein Q9M89_01860 [Persephonella sp.]|nr:hypothetical protein [Persephonella sp.]